MDMVVVQVPVQQDFARYGELLREKIDDSKIVRWYVSSIRDNVATIEAVIEITGVGGLGGCMARLARNDPLSHWDRG
ncbi:hypothetical protein B484DRAFT_395700 [Ochromonadaceae sp. CCMP2298]|nr:hypothetical protein B484DRAFT_395700 [Ochromonadaceae sp. CCMP2298]